jgi:hypothetical protein
MAAKVFFESVHTGKRFEIVSLDPKAGTVTLIGTTHKTPFVEKYTKERFEEMGYKLVREEVAAAPPPPPAPAPVPPAPVA